VKDAFDVEGLLHETRWECRHAHVDPNAAMHNTLAPYAPWTEWPFRDSDGEFDVCAPRDFIEYAVKNGAAVNFCPRATRGDSRFRTFVKTATVAATTNRYASASEACCGI